MNAEREFQNIQVAQSRVQANINRARNAAATARRPADMLSRRLRLKIRKNRPHEKTHGAWQRAVQTAVTASNRVGMYESIKNSLNAREERVRTALFHKYRVPQPRTRVRANRVAAALVRNAKAVVHGNMAEYELLKTHLPVHIVNKIIHSVKQ